MSESDFAMCFLLETPMRGYLFSIKPLGKMHDT